VEEDGVAPPVAEGKLYLTEEEWLERSKKKESDSGVAVQVAATVKVKVAAAVAEAKAVAAVVMEPTHRAGATTAIAVANRGIGPVSVGANNPKRIRRSNCLRPKRRRCFSCSLRSCLAALSRSRAVMWVLAGEDTTGASVLVGRTPVLLARVFWSKEKRPFSLSGSISSARLVEQRGW
jgi:hypothetical protein